MIILVIAYNRPHYFEQCLAHLSKVRGISNHTVFFQVDPWQSDVVRQCLEWTASPSSMLLNHERLGCNRNIYVGLERSFQHSDFVGIVEDDILVSEDWLEFVQRPELMVGNVMAVCTFRKHFGPIVNADFNGYEIGNYFCPWAWFTWRSTWDQIKSSWEQGGDGTWDTALNRRIFQLRPGTICVPAVGRSANIGVFGQYCHSEAEFRRSNYTPYWAGHLNDLTP